MMKKQVRKDFFRRLSVGKYENKRLSPGIVRNNTLLSTENRFTALTYISRLGKASPVRIRNRCVLSGRSRGIFKDLKVSRIMLRDLAAKALVPGLQKSS